MVLDELLSSILDVPPAELADETSQATLASWNSMAHINLITALEETYQVSFSTGEIQSIKTLGDVRSLLRVKGAAI